MSCLRCRAQLHLQRARGFLGRLLRTARTVESLLGLTCAATCSSCSRLGSLGVGAVSGLRWKSGPPGRQARIVCLIVFLGVWGCSCSGRHRRACCLHAASFATCEPGRDSCQAVPGSSKSTCTPSLPGEVGLPDELDLHSGSHEPGQRREVLLDAGFPPLRGGGLLPGGSRLGCATDGTHWCKRLVSRLHRAAIWQGRWCRIARRPRAQQQPSPHGARLL